LQQYSEFSFEIPGSFAVNIFHIVVSQARHLQVLFMRMEYLNLLI